MAASKKIKKSKSLKAASKNKNSSKTDISPVEKESQNDIFPIVGVGASAGGLEAFITFLSNLPTNTNMGFVLIQHQDPTHHSALPELLKKATTMPVSEVQDAIKVRPNHVYVMPSNTNMYMIDGTLKLRPRREARGLHMPIDSFFQSLAEIHKNHTIGVLLSGTASDGTIGLTAIKSAGGVTFAQDEESAKYSGMPQHAVNAGVVDFVLSPDQIAFEIGKIALHPFLSAPLRLNDPERDIRLSQNDQMNTIFQLLRKDSGVNFAQYKPNTILRRLSRRMVLQKTETLQEYVDYLKNNPKELTLLYDDILINVTNFFRDPETFEILKSEIFPKLIKPESEKTIRIWVPGCSTGEEVYSLAISLIEYLNNREKIPPLQIFGTDISENAIEKARTGMYSYDIQKDVNPDRLRRFFTKNDQGLQINKSVRDLCIFAHHNVTKDPPFSKMDLISCRNLLIYLGQILQRKVVPVFHYALNPNGYLMLGSTEDVGGFTEYFYPADRKHRIFSRKLTASRIQFDIAKNVGLDHHIERDSNSKSPEVVSEKDVLKAGDRIILAKYVPASVIINDEMEILQFRGRTGNYLEPASGQASLNVIMMAREGFAMELRNAVNRCKMQRAPVIVQGLSTKVNGHIEHFNLEIIPFSPVRSSERFFLIFFNAIPSFKETTKGRSARTIRPLAKKERIQMARLEQELLATKEYLQSIIDEQEATNEELRAANEEILANNEELQSTNEEMETAKEELQSANEELTTVNEELHNRNIELNTINNDLNNLLASVHIPTLMIGPDLRIRRFTPMAEKVMNLLPSDIGRPITDINLSLKIGNLEELILDVIDSMQYKEMDVQDRRGHWYQLQARPYKTLENKIEGAVLVLIDIDVIKRNLGEISKYKDYCESIVDNAHDSFLILNRDFDIVMANRSFYRTFGIRHDVTGTNLNDLEDGAWNSPDLRKILIDMIKKNRKLENFRFEQVFPRIGNKVLLINGSGLPIENTGERNVLLAIEDISASD